MRVLNKKKNFELFYRRNAANYFETMQVKYEEGQKEGVKRKTQEILLAMFQAGNSDENISLVMNIPIEEVKVLRKKSSLKEWGKYKN
ncbi:TPA: hypothetical protein U0431_000446 [Streptococcus suis]|nr:hypothetical protein [Streptococcus suis]